MNTTAPGEKLKTNPIQATFQATTATLLAFCLFAFFAFAKEAHGSGLLIADGVFGGVLEIKEQDVKVTINNGIAVTEINQVFLNTENHIVEALYTFPVPKGASVSNFSMIINGKEMIGEVLEKQRARSIYESYKSTRVDPGLLEQVDYKRFEMRVFPIAANAEQHIKVTYYQQLDFDHDWATYVYPLATSTKGAAERTTGKFALTLDVNSEIPITELKSPSHGDDFVVVNHNSNYARASLETTAGDLSRDVVLAFQTKRPRTGVDMIASKARGEDGYFMLTMTAGEELEGKTSGLDYLFVLDISGSMANKGKLGLSTNATHAFVSSLGAEDRFEVMTFNNAPNLHFSELRSVSEESKTSAKEFLDSQKARGGTALKPALNAAFKYKDADRPMNIVILSDGMTKQNEQAQLLSSLGSAPEGTRVFCIGIGNEVNRPLLKQLAENAGGLGAFISQGDDFDRQAEAFRRKLTHPVATELKIEIDGAEVYDVLPRTLPNLYHGTPVRMIGRYKSSGNGSAKISGNVMGRPFAQTVELDFPAVEEDNPQIERMWAYSHVQSLMNEVRTNGETAKLKENIVQLCEGYSIVSQYASFIVLENDREYKRWKIERRNATRIKRDRNARKKVADQLNRIREKSLAEIGPQSRTKTASRKTSSPQNENRDTASRPTQQQQYSPVSTRSQDLDFSTPQSNNSGSRRSGGGGGAIDPITGSNALSMAGAAALRRRRKKKDEIVIQD